MANVFLCSPTNSTMFTTCCEVAILDSEKDCPRCKEEIEQQGHGERWRYAYGKQKRGEK